jgi:uncharacterized RDD family membrane protein YckC
MEIQKASILNRFLAHSITGMLNYAVGSVAITFSETIPSVSIFIILLYLFFLSFFYKKGLCPGKYILHLQVYDNKTKKPAKFLKMFIRDVFLKAISSIFYIGFIYAFFNKEELTFHDITSRTHVVQISKNKD